MKPTIAFFASHDASICVRNESGEYRVFELERLLKERFARIDLREDYKDIYNRMKSVIKAECSIDRFETAYHLQLPEEHQIYLRQAFGIRNFIESYHHISHAACSFYQSSFEEALVISYDGGGFDGGTGPDRVTFFNLYKASRKNGIKRLAYFPIDLGTAYGLMALPIADIDKTEANWGQKFLGFPGKVMGIAGYGQPNEIWLPAFKEYYLKVKQIKPYDLDSIARSTGHDLGINKAPRDVGYALAATSQAAFESIIMEKLGPYLEISSLPICLTGGCALNVIFNQRLKNELKVPIFVPPNPSDCGLTFGMIANSEKPQEAVHLMYSGFPILDKDKLEQYVEKYNAKKINTSELAGILAQGKIVGLMRGNSEHGPRALGNRSILCDPSYPDMKDKLNHKVKFREWFRPFAPMIKVEDVSKYFEFEGEAPYMSFSPKVRTEWRDKIPAVVHVDGTSRVQTVSKQQNEYIYELLGEFEQFQKFGVILNTSFNIKGKPILTTIEDALEILETTEIDYVVIEDYLFSKLEI